MRSEGLWLKREWNNDWGGGGGDNYKKLYVVLSYLGVFTFVHVF